jgi:membrane protein
MGFIEIRDHLIGFIVGILANVIGVLSYIVIFSKHTIYDTLLDAFYKGYLGKLILLGALLNLAVFFFFIRRYENERARGVLIATALLAVVILILQII